MSKKVGFLEWKATPEGQEAFKRYLQIYSDGTIRAEIEKMWAWSQGQEKTEKRTPRGWVLFVRNWMMAKPLFDAKRKMMTARQEEDHYASKERWRDSDKPMESIGDILRGIVKEPKKDLTSDS